MSTVTLHTDVQRTRFVQHALAALASMAYSAWNLPLRAMTPGAALTPAEQASFEARKVRDMAYSYAKTDPGFAADLYAAAARHEGLYED